MADKARKETDKILHEMEKEVDAIYSRASKEISEKWDKYMESHKGKVTSAYNDLQNALASGDAQAIREAKSVYERTVKNVTLNNDRYKAMVKETTAKLSHTNEVALDYVNGNMAKIYTLNYNEFANQDISGYTFTLVNEQAVSNLAKEDKSLLPKKKVDIPKDKAWNTKSINAEVLQGILQGENIPKIAERLTHVTDMNKNSSIRNARTMVTGAENKGRQDSFKKAQSDGVIMVRQWVATNDDRTREAHAELDGQEVGIDEPWENEYGEIMYPGDPAADPANVYNCRCSIRSIVQGFKWDEEEVSDITEEDPYNKYQDLTYVQMRDEVLEGDERREFAKLIEKGAKDEGSSYAEYWHRLKDGRYQNEEVENLINRISGTNKDESQSGEDRNLDKDRQEGIELLRTFVEGGSSEIHELAGYDPFSWGDYDKSKADEEALRKLDMVFTEAKDQGTLYKGITMTEEDIQRLDGSKETIHSLSSTSVDKRVAQDYSSSGVESYEEIGLEGYRVVEKITVEDGTPVANVKEVLGESGMKAYEKEITIGRETEWSYGEFKKHTEKSGEVYYTVDVIIRRKKK